MFFPQDKLQRLRANVEHLAWAKPLRDNLLAACRPWMDMSYDDLWSLMFGPGITRTWMVWSNGYCPSCQAKVPMYEWRMEALAQPWKVRCPHCKELFPKNDFLRYYRSGLNAQGVFVPHQADRSLLFNTEHPDPSDPLRSFGVDDGEGFVQEQNRWRFIGAYLIYGQWKQAVLGGLMRLADAYVLTGGSEYARRAAILLDRIADFYPAFDYRTQGLTYETPGNDGYVSVWHDSCGETRVMAFAYDAIASGFDGDSALVEFLAGRAAKAGLENPKKTSGDIRRNIEDRILADAFSHPAKIHCNFPMRETCQVTLQAVLDWPRYRQDVLAQIGAVIDEATAVDGVTGEKGLAGYSSMVLQSLAMLLGQFDNAEPGFLREMLRKHPSLAKTWRFNIDTWCFQKYYPLTGDTGWFAKTTDQYGGSFLTVPNWDRGSIFSDTAPGMATNWTLLWRLYEATGDTAYVKAMVQANGGKADGIPYDAMFPDTDAVEGRIRRIIEDEGPIIPLASVDKKEWHLAILRGGSKADPFAVWLDYDSGGKHSHADGMNLGLFAMGLDLMPDLGYPPVQYGGWLSKQCNWYRGTASHNTVLVDGANQDHGWEFVPIGGATKMWGDGKVLHAVRASGAKIYEKSRQYERTVLVAAIDERDFYFLDIFRVVGGKEHAKFTGSHFGTVTTGGLSLAPAPDFGHETLMRAFQTDPAPAPGWWADWKIEDRYKLLPAPADLHFRHIDLTSGAAASVCESWLVPGSYSNAEETWLPRVMVLRRADAAPLASTFVAVMEPYRDRPILAGWRRLTLKDSLGRDFGDSHVAVEVKTAGGLTDLFVAADVENPQGLQPAYKPGEAILQSDWQLSLDGEACFIRKDPAGRIRHITLANATSCSVAGVRISLHRLTDFLEVSLEPSGPVVVTGDPSAVKEITTGRAGQ